MQMHWYNVHGAAQYTYKYKYNEAALARLQCHVHGRASAVYN